MQNRITEGSTMTPSARSKRVFLPDGTPEYVSWAECYLAGGAMYADAAEVRALRVAPEDFHDARLQILWRAIATVAQRGDPLLPLVAKELEPSGDLDRIGGEPYLTKLFMDPRAATYSYQAALHAHAGLVRGDAARRRLIAQASDAAGAAGQGRVGVARSILRTAGQAFSGGFSLDFDEVIGAGQ